MYPASPARNSAGILAAACFAALLCVPFTASRAANTGIPIAGGGTATSAIEPADDADSYVFDAAEGTKLSACVKRTADSGLEPWLELVSPSGTLLDAAVKASTKKAALKLAPLPETGRYALVVRSVDGTAGGYALKLKATPPKKVAVPTATLVAGETLDVPFAGCGGCVASISVKPRTRGVEVRLTDLLDPAGKRVAGFADALREKSGGVSGRVDLTGTFGVYRLRIGGAAAETDVDVSLKVSWPKPAKSARTISSKEPRIAAAYSAASGEPRGAVGAEITVDGSGFDVVNPGLALWVGGKTATLTSKTVTRIRATVPAVDDGPQDVTVANPDGNTHTLPAGFDVVGPAPTILGVDPAMSPVGGGVVVTVTGTGLGNVTAVKIGTVKLAAAPRVVDDRTVTFTTEAHAEGTFFLYLVDAYGQPSPKPPSFRVLAAPRIDAVDPAGSGVDGGVTVVVHGPNLLPDDEVYLDDQPVEVVFDPPDGLRFVTPPHPEGVVALRVVDPFGQETTLADGFEFGPACLVNESSSRIPDDGFLNLIRGCALVLADLDGGRDADLIIGRETRNDDEKLLKILMNDGSGFFSPEAVVLPGVRADLGEYLQASAIAAGDVDGDGDLDLAITTGSLIRNPELRSYGSYPTVRAYGTPYPSTRLLLNDGKMSFQVAEGALPDILGQGSDLLQGNSLAFGDLDGDEDLDLVVTRREAQGFTSFTDSGGGFYSYYPVTRDFTVDYDRTGPATRVLLNDGAGVFSDVTADSMPAPAAGDLFAGDRVLLADVDGDDDLDLVVIIESANARTGGKREFVDPAKTGSASKTRILLNDGSGSFTNATATLLPAAKSWDDWSGFDVAFGDLDGDGYGDLVLTTDRDLLYFDPTLPGTRRPSKTRVLRGTDENTFVDATVEVMPAVRADAKGEHYEGRALVLGDLDGDKFPDLVVTGPTKQFAADPVTGAFDVQIPSTRILLSREGALRDVTSTWLPNVKYKTEAFRAHALALGDIDGDKDLDVVLTTSEPDIRSTRTLILK